MKLVGIGVFVLLVWLLVVGECSQDTKYNIFYQSHSWNDLNEFDQMYRKGVQYSKVDMHYINSKSFCDSQIGVVNYYDGCFLMSHDTPYPDVQYNTSDQLIDYIVGNRETWYSMDSPLKKYISLCFKLDDTSPCDGSANSLAFINATSYLIENLIFGMLDTYSLNLEFIVDGSGAPLDCLANHWRPLVSTWIGNPFMAMDSNNETLGYDLFQVADLPVEVGFPSFWLDKMCFLSPPYGKFRNSSYPILVWEPSDQDEIQSVENSFIKCMLSNPDLEFTDLRFAGNIDPVQFQIYSSALSNQGWNIQISCYNSSYEKEMESSFQWEDTSNTFNSKIISLNITNQVYYFLFFKNSTSNYNIYYHVYTSKSQFSQFLYLHTLSLDLGVKSFKDIQVIQLFELNFQQYLFISDNYYSYLVFTFNDETFEFHLSKTGATISPEADKDIGFKPISKLYLLDSDQQQVNSSIVAIEYYYSERSLTVNFWDLENISTNSSIALINTITIPDIFPDDFIVRNFDLVHIFNSTNTEIMVVMLLSTELNSIYGMLLNVSRDFELLSFREPVYLDVGSDVSMSIQNFNGVNYIMEVHSNGYCYNTELNNKRPSPRVCESSPISFPHILNYNYGSLDDWLSHFSNKNIFSSCSPNVLHGTYDQGSYPNVHLYISTLEEEPSLNVISVHQGISHEFIDISMCGYATRWSQVVLDSWTLYQ